MKKWIFLPFVILLFSCSNENKIVDQMIDIPKSEWTYDQIPDYPFQVENTNIYHDFYIKLRVSKSYKYENLYLLSHIHEPNGKIKNQTINLTLTDSTGKPLGQSTGSAIDYEFPMGKMSFKEVGQYKIALEQNMRDSMVNGIESIGVRIMKGEPVF
ncbi:MAG: gliding motility lipoprotein GldH [Bacteroidia bacterium]